MATKPATKTVVKKRKVTAAKKASTTKKVVHNLRQFLTLKVQTEAFEKRLDDLKKELSEAVETVGYEDDKGHYWFDLPEPVEVDGYGVCTKLKRQRSVSQPLDEDAAEKILRKKKLYDECTTTIVVLDEEKIRKAYFEDKLTADDLDEIFPQKIQWSFRPQK